MIPLHYMYVPVAATKPNLTYKTALRRVSSCIMMGDQTLQG